jgi:predicted DNA-binding transcriptional regulator AlpA
MPDDDRIILPEKLPDLGVDYSDKHRRDIEAVGKFPKRVQLSPRKHGYIYSEIMAWIRARIAERDHAS